MIFIGIWMMFMGVTLGGRLSPTMLGMRWIGTTNFMAMPIDFHQAL